jgi:hypothetical protein
MRKILTITAALLATVGAAHSQLRVPNEEDILAKTMTPGSTHYYPRMMERYMAGDETLTNDDYFYLYYGYAYEPGFDARAPLPGEKEIADIFARQTQSERVYLGQPTDDEARAIITAAQKNMTVDPFSPANINLMTFAYELTGDTLNARISADRFRKVVHTITSSGTGLRERSPWHILRYSHADDIIEARGLRVVNRQVRALDVEYIQVDRNPEGVRGYFFNFGRVYGRNDQ